MTIYLPRYIVAVVLANFRDVFFWTSLIRITYLPTCEHKDKNIRRQKIFLYFFFR